MLCQQHWWLVPSSFLIPHYFLLLRFLLQKPLADFPVLGGPRRLTFGLSFSKAFRFHFFRSTFWLLSLLSFFPSKLISFCHAERPPATFLGGFSSWVPLSTRPLLIGCSFPNLLIPFLHYWVANRDIFVLVSCVF